MEAGSDVRARVIPMPQGPKLPGPDPSAFWTRRAETRPEAPAFEQIVRVLRRRRKVVFAAAALGVVLAAVAGLTAPTRYTATAQIVVELRPVDGPGGAAATSPAVEESAIETQVAMLGSEAHLRLVLESLGPPPAAGSDSPAWLRELREHARSALATARSYLPRSASRTGKERIDETPGLAELRNGVRIAQDRRSRVINVSFSGPNPDRAAKVASEVARIHVERLADRLRAERFRTLEWLERRVPELQADVERAEAAVQAFRLEHGSADGAAPDETSQQVASFSRQSAVLRSDAAATELRLRQIARLRREGAPTSVLADALDSPELRDLSARETEADAGSPRDLRPAIENAVQRGSDQLDRDLQAARAQAQAIEARLEVVKAGGQERVGEQASLRALERQATAVAQLYDALLRRRQEIAEQMNLAQPEARLLAPAWPPEHPSSLHPLLFVPPALIAFSLGGCLLAFGLGRFDRRLYDEGAVAEALGVPCIGHLPSSRDRRRRRGVWDGALRSLVASALGSVAGRHGPKTLLVTSSLPDEDGTTLSWGIARLIAQHGRRVLLLDALPVRCFEAAKHDFAEQQGSPPARAAEQIEGWVAAIKPVPVLGIDRLSAPDLLLDLIPPLAGKQLDQLIERLEQAYDYIVVDGPPALAGEGSKLLAGVVDLVLFAVRWRSTTGDVASAALRRLDPEGVCAVLAVLTAVSSKRYGRDLLGARAKAAHRLS